MPAVDLDVAGDDDAAAADVSNSAEIRSLTPNS